MTTPMSGSASTAKAPGVSQLRTSWPSRGTTMSRAAIVRPVSNGSRGASHLLVEELPMPFDNEAFTKWLQQFERDLIECGMPERQAMRYRTEYYNDAVGLYVS